MSSGPGRREVAYRLFAAEFDDAEFSYSESDEERAPNYVVTPTGGRVNRLFAVGVLTEVEDVNPEMVRGRVVDPTGAFVTYAGQYQPDALAFLERTDPPVFVALSGKARTFEPEDDDVVYSSVRPESVGEVDGETRDRWVVAAAERTLERVGIMAAAIEAGLAGDQLRGALVEAGVDERLADGVALALEYYGTTPAYLEAVHDLAVDAARVVAGELDEVGRLDVAPDDAGGPGAASASDLATVDLSGAPSPATAAAAADAGGDETTDDGPAAGDATDSDDGGETIEVTEGSSAATGSEAASEPDRGSEPDEATTTDTAASSADTDDGRGSGDALEAGSTGDDAEDDDDEAGSPDDAGVGDVGASGDEEDEPGDFDPGEFDLDEETRAEVEEEYGTEFSTADEVEEAGIETPEPDPEPASEPDPADETAETDDAAAPDVGGETEAVSAPADAGDEEAAETDADEGSADVDLEDAVMDAMESVGDGDGADREALVAAVVDEHGVDPEAVENAIQDALMSGRCYEPADGTLKAI